MIKTLTPREKAMLYFLAVFLLAAGCFNFIITPMRERSAELRDVVDMTREMAQTIDNAARSAQTAGADIAELKAATAALLARQMPHTSNSELGEMITKLISDCGMEPVSLDLGTAREDGVPTFGVQAEPGEEAPRTTLNTANAVFSGSLSSLSRFIEAIDGMDGARLTWLSYSRPDSGNSYMFNVGLVIYMDAGASG